MEHRKKILIYAIGTLILWVLIYCLRLFFQTQPCQGTLETCLTYQLNLGFLGPLLILLPYLLGLFIFLFFFSKKVFVIWRNCSIVLLPLVLLVIGLTPVSCRGFICFDRGNIARGLSFLYALVSVLVIIISAIVFKVKEKKSVVQK